MEQIVDSNNCNKCNPTTRRKWGGHLYAFLDVYLKWFDPYFLLILHSSKSLANVFVKLIKDYLLIYLLTVTHCVPEVIGEDATRRVSSRINISIHLPCISFYHAFIVNTSTKTQIRFYSDRVGNSYVLHHFVFQFSRASLKVGPWPPGHPSKVATD